ncbi:hypothetical protein F5141DRAFT_363816 [Pisolithus sp. B1]|nr:hypothetical protein F5141DRAFT_363816 [Pisolithus sp. B1]
MIPASESEFANLCDVCSKLDILQRMTHPPHPCREPLPCSINAVQFIYRAGVALGSIDEIKSRRLSCDLCQLIAGCLDKEPSDLSGTCRVTEEFWYFQLPRKVEAQDPSITHFHISEATVIFDTSEMNQFQGPSLPWEVKAKGTRGCHSILCFQAKARSFAEPGDPTAVAPQMKQEPFNAIGGKYVPAQVNTHLIRAWLHECETKHGKDCRPSLPLSVERTRGAYIRDRYDPVVPRTYSFAMSLRCFKLCLGHSCCVQTPPREHPRSSEDRLLTLAAYPRHNQGLHDSGTCHRRTLPMGRFTCIIQNDLEMLQAEITRMGSIYLKALFTIIAAAGDSADSGLPGVEWGSREQVQKTLKFVDGELLTVIDVPPSGIDDTPWARRAWTFQERILSNRLLVFSAGQVYWSCRAAAHSEERTLEEVGVIERLHSSFPQRHTTEFLSWEPLQQSEYRILYSTLITSYRQRRLSYQTDMLNALMAFPRFSQHSRDDTFFWGLPGLLFSYAMTWDFIGHSTRNHVHVPITGSNGCKEMVPIPSWSWAAWSEENSNHPPYLYAGEGRHTRPVIDFNIVDAKHQLVKIKEWPWQDHPDDGIRASWQEREPRQLPSPTQYSLSQVGYLYFWTGLANVRAARIWGGGKYILSPSPSPPNFYREIVHQDFIVIGAYSDRILLLAIEWRDGVAYRTGTADIDERKWVHMENRQWRLITLG